MDYPIKFGDQLKQQLRSYRKARGLTQEQLGQLVGVTQRRIAEIEANPGVVAFDQVVAIVSALGAELVVRDNAKGPMPSSHRPAAPRAPYEFRNALLPSARHLIAHLTGDKARAPEAMLWRRDEDGDVPAQLTPDDRRRLVNALASAILINPKVLDAELGQGSHRASSQPHGAGGENVSEIHAQWASALGVSPQGLRESVLAAIAHRSAPHGLAQSPSKGSW